MTTTNYKMIPFAEIRYNLNSTAPDIISHEPSSPENVFLSEVVVKQHVSHVPTTTETINTDISHFLGLIIAASKFKIGVMHPSTVTDGGTYWLIHECQFSSRPRQAAFYQSIPLRLLYADIAGHWLSSGVHIGCYCKHPVENN